MNNYLDFLSTIAQILGFPLAIASILVSIWIYQKSKQRRELSCTIDPIISPIEIKAGDALKGEIEIRYKGAVVQNLFVVRVLLKNTGNTPIRKVDVFEPVTFSFGKDTEFLREPRIITEVPTNLNSKWNTRTSKESVNPNVAYLEFDLLNPGWETSAEFLCSGKSSLPSITAKIEGILNIGQVDYEEQKIKRTLKDNMVLSLLTTLILSGLLPILMSIFNKSIDYPLLFWGLLAVTGASIMSLMIGAFSLFFSRSFSKSRTKKEQPSQ